MNTWKTDKYCCVDHPGYGTSHVRIVLSQDGHISPRPQPVLVFPVPLSHPHTTPRVQLSTCCCLPLLLFQLRACPQSLSQSTHFHRASGQAHRALTRLHGTSSVRQSHLSLFHFIQHRDFCETKLVVPEVQINSGPQ